MCPTVQPAALSAVRTRNSGSSSGSSFFLHSIFILTFICPFCCCCYSISQFIPQVKYLSYPQIICLTACRLAATSWGVRAGPPIIRSPGGTTLKKQKNFSSCSCTLFTCANTTDFHALKIRKFFMQPTSVAHCKHSLVGLLSFSNKFL